MAALSSVGLLLLGIVVVAVLQGCGCSPFSHPRCDSTGVALKISRLVLRVLSRSIERSFPYYRRHRRAMFLSAGSFFLGWLVEALEVYAIPVCPRVPADPLRAVAIRPWP